MHYAVICIIYEIAGRSTNSFGLINKILESDTKVNAKDQRSSQPTRIFFCLYQCSDQRDDAVLRMHLQTASSPPNLRQPFPVPQTHPALYSSLRLAISLLSPLA